MTTSHLSLSKASINASEMIRGRFRPLCGGQLNRHVALLTGGTVLSQGIVIAASPILTRLYAPGDFGTLGVFLSLVSILTVVATLCYDIAIPLPKTDDEGRAILVLSLMIVAITTVSLTVVIWLFRTSLVRCVVISTLTPYLWLLPIAMGFTGVSQTFNYWALRKKSFRLIAYTTFQQKLIAVLLQLACFSFGCLGLLLGQIMAKAVSACTLIAITLCREQRGGTVTNCHTMAQMASRYRRFPQISSFSALINAAGTHLPVVLFAGLYGPFVAGQFALVQRVVSLPMSCGGRAVAQVYFGEIASLRHTSPANLRDLFLRASKRLALLSIIPLAILLTSATWLFPFLFGETWASAGQFACVMGPAATSRLIAAPFSQTLNVLERQSWQLGWDIVRLILVVASITASTWLGSSPVWSVAAYSIAMCVAYLGLWLLSIVGINQTMCLNQSANETSTCET